jgi:hypothetical protein
VTLRILSLAEADLLTGFRFYERQAPGYRLVFSRVAEFRY